MVALTGKETLQVQGQDATGQPAASTLICSTQDVANLAAAQSNLKITAINTVGAGTITAAGIVGRTVARGGAQVAAFTDTTATAAQILAALPSTSDTTATFEFQLQNLSAFAETLTGGTGVTLAGNTVIPPLSVGRFLVAMQSATTATITGISTSPITTLLPEASTTINTAGAGTLTAASIAGLLINRTTATGAFTDTTDTAANIIAGLPNAQVGQSFEMIYQNNTTNGVATIAGGASVTASGTLVVPYGYALRALVTVATASTVTFQGLGVFPIANNTAGGIGTTTGAVATGSYSQSSNTALANVTGLVSGQLVPGATYLFDGYLATTNNATGGIKLAWSAGGGLTATSFLQDTWVYNTTTVSAEVNITSLASNMVNSAVAATAVQFSGTLVVNAGGTLQLQAAQNTSNGTALTIADNSYIMFTRIA